MVSAKLLAFLPLFGSIAAAAAATSATTNSADDFDLEVYKAEALLSPEVAIWPGVDADLKLLFPGVTCQLTTGNTTTTKRAAPTPTARPSRRTSSPSSRPSSAPARSTGPSSR